ncbi:MAG: YraN family protein [Zetaproteobacteria bacterium]|nr:MAG: YraN family protein [Zetaproteobacteria bacterium]
MGRAAEELAARHLVRRGFTILDRNARGGRGELDLVARRDGLLLFVEVKAHRLPERSMGAMTPEKQRRLVSAAEAWLARHPTLAGLQCRFDLLIVTPDSHQIAHYEDAFRP